MSSMPNIQQPQISQRKAFSVVKASGENILTYLQGQITQDTKLLSPSQSLYSAILTAQGKVMTDFHLLHSAENEVIFLCPSTSAVTLVERLRRYALGYQLRIGVVSAWQVCSIQGQGVDAYLKQHHLPIPEQQPLATQADQHIFSMRYAEAGDDGVWLIGEQLAIESNIDESQMIQQRIIKGIPMFGTDWDDKGFPLNANLIEREGVSFDKGCYVGQEVTSRMHWRGGIKKKLYRVQLEQMPSSLPSPMLSNGIQIGAVSSMATSAQGHAIGIALLPITIVESNKPLTSEDNQPIQILGNC